MKPIVVAGNGPSLAQIDYSRLPQDFDVFRCNQFYCEDKYFLGKKIKGVFLARGLFFEQYYTIQEIITKKEYEIENIFCAFCTEEYDDNQSRVLTPQEIVDEFSWKYPNVSTTYPLLQKLPELHNILRFFQNYYNLKYTTGFLMLISAIALGYREIYLVGIDFYTSGLCSYAYNTDIHTNINKFIFQNKAKKLEDYGHSKELEIISIRTILREYDLKIYSLSPNAEITTLIPIAPFAQKQEKCYILENKKNYICDIIFPEKSQINKQTLRKKLKKTLNKDNLIARLIRDTLIFLSAIIKILMGK